MAKWYENEVQRFENEDKRRIEEGGVADYIKVGEGVTTVRIDLDSAPEIINGRFGKRHSIKTVEPAAKHIDMTDKLYETFVKAIKGKSGVVKVNIIRTGKTREDTKYVVQIVQ